MRSESETPSTVTDRKPLEGEAASGSLDVEATFAKLARQGRQKGFGWTALDRLEIGFNAGDLAILAGRTGHGKSTALLNILANWLEKHGDEYYILFSHEIPQEAVAVKLLSILTRRHGGLGWSFHQIRSWAQTGVVPKNLDKQEIENAIKHLARWQKNLYIFYRPEWNVLEVVRQARALADSKPNLGGIMVDYLQLVPPPPGQYESLEHEVSTTAKHIKQLGVELACPMIAAAQIGYEAAKLEEWIPSGDIEDEKVLRAIAKRRPQLHHLRQGGGEQEADMVIGLLNYRADYITALEDAESDRRRLAEVGTWGQFDVAVIKNRYGLLGIAPLILESQSGYVRDPGVFGR